MLRMRCTRARSCEFFWEPHSVAHPHAATDSCNYQIRTMTGLTLRPTQAARREASKTHPTQAIQLRLSSMTITMTIILPAAIPITITITITLTMTQTPPPYATLSLSSRTPWTVQATQPSQQRCESTTMVFKYSNVITCALIGYCSGCTRPLSRTNSVRGKSRSGVKVGKGGGTRWCGDCLRCTKWGKMRVRRITRIA